MEDFFTLYQILMHNLMNRTMENDDYFKITIYYLGNKFNIKINMMPSNNIIYNDSFECSELEYNYLVQKIANQFIEEHDITLPAFDSYVSNDVVRAYYNNVNGLKNPLDYDKFLNHILRNDKFELNMYYFNGITQQASDIEHKALDKFNSKTEKTKRLK